MKHFILLSFSWLFPFLLVKAQENNTQRKPLPVHYIQHINNPEDLIEVPGTNWVMASSMAEDGNASGEIYGINLLTEQVLLLFAMGAGDKHSGYRLARFAPHGINIRQTGTNRYELLVINHGSREAIEFFQLFHDQPNRYGFNCCPFSA